MSSNQKWDVELYDRKHSFVSAYGNDLVKLLAPEKGELILDLGCGTGDLSKVIFDLGSRVIGIDASNEMIEEASAKYPMINFRVMDATDIKLEEKFDAVFSNAVLHWIKQPEEVLEASSSVLKAGGRFIVEFGGRGNCETITNCLIAIMNEKGYNYDMNEFPWYFPSIGEYTSLLEKHGFEVEYAIHFKRPTKLSGDGGFIDWINMFAGNLYKRVPDDQRNIISKIAEGRLKDVLYQNGEWFADYKRIRVVARKI